MTGRAWGASIRCLAWLAAVCVGACGGGGGGGGGQDDVATRQDTGPVAATDLSSSADLPPAPDAVAGTVTLSGVAYTFDIGESMQLVPKASFAWEHECLDTSYDIEAELWDERFRMDGYDVEQDHFQGKAGLCLRVDESVELFAVYTADFTDGARSDTVNVGVSVQW